MGQGVVRSLIVQAGYRAILIVAITALVAGCSWFGGSGSGGGRPNVPAQIFLDAPQNGATINSSFEIRGRTSGLAAGSNLVYRVFDGSEQLIGTGVFAIAGGGQGDAMFATLGNYNTTASGPGRVEVVDLNTTTGAVQAIASVRVNLGTGTAPQPTQQTPSVLPTTAATAAPTAVAQRILIDTPAPGTVVGSPMVITGRTSLYPQGGQLNYRVLNAAGAQIGAGAFPAFGITGGPANFTAELNFQVPPGPTSIRAEIFDQSPATGAVLASTSVELRIGAPPPAAQAIIIETPPPGVFVGSPVVLTGRTTQYPFQGNLAWLATDPLGRQLGTGIFPVNGSPGQPTSFAASLNFQIPSGGGLVRFEIYDQDAVTGAVVARSTIELQTNAAPVQPTAQPTATNAPPTVQQIIIDTPPPGTFVGSPVVITGRTALYPFGGQLAYRFRDGQGSPLGSGAIRVAGQAGSSGSFNEQLFFDLRPGFGQIFLDIFENGPTNQIVASATIMLQVRGGPPATPVPPIATVTPQPTLPAPIVIDTPAEGTVVGSPVVITGRTNLFPNGGLLNWQILDAQRRVLGEGRFSVNGGSGGISSFSPSLEFQIPATGRLFVDIFRIDPTTGQPAERATIALTTNPAYPVPLPAPRTP
jgi:hypothetical protein